MARHEIVFEDMINQGATLSDVRAYILLRNSALPAKDKKRVVTEAKGNLKYEAVTQAIRMLGAKFFLKSEDKQNLTVARRMKSTMCRMLMRRLNIMIIQTYSNYVFSAEGSECA